MKYAKALLIALLGVIWPFAIIRISIDYPALTDFAEVILYLFPVYLPVFCGLFGVTLYKMTEKIFLPNFIFNLFLIVGAYFLSEMILNAIERRLADAVIALLLMGPPVYSVPISFIAAAIYKHQKKMANMQNSNEDDTVNKTEI